MAASANLRRNFESRAHGRIVRIGGVIAGWTMAVLTLDTFQVGRGSGAGKPAGQPVTNRMAGQTAWVFILMNLLQSRERLGMPSIRDSIMNALMALDTRS
jgi:hypothetical protein